MEAGPQGLSPTRGGIKPGDGRSCAGTQAVLVRGDPGELCCER